METISSSELVEQYAKEIEPLLPLAQKAYGSRERPGPEHDASRKYTALLSEFQEMGGSLPLMAKRLNVAYAGIRRRVAMRHISASSFKPKFTKKNVEEVDKALERVLKAKKEGTDSYHDQLATEYFSGMAFSVLARRMGLSSAAPLYYGVQRSIQRNTR
jgi:hypothetical protein